MPEIAGNQATDNWQRFFRFWLSRRFWVISIALASSGYSRQPGANPKVPSMACKPRFRQNWPAPGALGVLRLASRHHAEPRVSMVCRQKLAKCQQRKPGRFDTAQPPAQIVRNGDESPPVTNTARACFARRNQRLAARLVPHDPTNVRRRRQRPRDQMARAMRGNFAATKRGRRRTAIVAPLVGATDRAHTKPAVRPLRG